MNFLFFWESAAAFVQRLRLHHPTMPRRKPASSKAKKAQVQAKRMKNKESRAKQHLQEQYESGRRSRPPPPSSSTTTSTDGGGMLRPPGNVVVTSFGGSTTNPEDVRLSTFFFREDDAEVQRRRNDGGRPLDVQPCRQKSKSNSKSSHSTSSSQPVTDFVGDDSMSSSSDGLSHPTRPPWNPSIPADVHEKMEQEKFDQWSDDMRTRHPNIPPYELNVEVWRQLWRVCEFSQSIIVVTDVRCPSFHLPPSLMEELLIVRRKHVVILLNKVDLVEKSHVDRWKVRNILFYNPNYSRYH